MRRLIRSLLLKKLNRSPDLQVEIGSIELHLLRGVIVLLDAVVVQRSARHPVVQVNCREAALEFDWRALVRKRLVGRIDIRDPDVQILAESRPSSDDHDPTGNLLALCRKTRELLPFHFRTIELRGGRVEFSSLNSTPQYSLRVADISLTATNLTNIDEVAAAGGAQILVTGRTTGEGRLRVSLTIPSLLNSLTFDLRAELKEMNLVALNDLLRAHAHFDLQRGICSLVAAFAVEDGRYEGFVQPHFRDLDVFAWQKEHGKGLFHICRQAVIALLAAIFKNQARDELALNIPIAGTFLDNDVDTWSAVGSLLRNAFIQSLLPTPGEPTNRTTRPRQLPSTRSYQPGFSW